MLTGIVKTVAGVGEGGVEGGGCWDILYELRACEFVVQCLAENSPGSC